MTDFEQPSLSADEVLARLTPGARIRYAFAALAGLAGAVLVVTLWVTEPVPARTQVAFGLLAVVVAATTGAALVTAATTLLIRARARHASLLRRKAALGP
ncbi:hypothetical protein AB5J62_12635 [Amycolatopsis sp. cg5]|uniref:hypothetical protein n=1 Tax=Amycolatopsis sp. cg5 TaxID=3238802 RepID=UPI003523CE95